MRRTARSLATLPAASILLSLVATPVLARPGGGHRFSAPSPPPRSFSPSPSPRPSPPPYRPSPAPAPWSPSPAPAPYSPSPSPRYDRGSDPSRYPDPLSDYQPSSYTAPPSPPGDNAGTVWLWLGGGAALLVGYVALNVALERRRRQDWVLGAMEDTVVPIVVRRPPPVVAPDHPRRALTRLLAEHDPDFSLVLFDDFLYALFTAYHEARGGSTRHDVTPYVEGDAERFLRSGVKADVRNVIVGAMELTNVTDRGGAIAVEVTFEANYEEVHGGRTQAYYSHETWVLQRSKAAKSRAPEHASIDSCPNCGGALENLDGNVCGFCQETLTPGRFDWALTHLETQRETRGPMLTGAVAEVGTELPTVIVAGARERFGALTQRDPKFSWPAFQQRVALVFAALHDGWTSRDWRRVRPFVSDQLFQTQLYWIEEYKRQRLQNHTDGARIVDMHLSNVESDRHFDAITVRVFATGKDFTVDEAGKLVSGSKTFDRRYTEYWTLIRSASASRDVHVEPSCPNCGAAVRVNMAGACEHCHVKVTRGDFDWVLSRIEQDETYR